MSKEKEKSYLLKNVRCIFPNLYEVGKFGKYGAVLLLDNTKDETQITSLRKAIQELIQDSFKVKKIPTSDTCLRDGDDSGKEYYEGYQVLTVGNRTQPYEVDRDGKSRVTEESESRIYSGCYVNCRISFWAQQSGSNDKGAWPRRINGNLISIQYAGKGDPFKGHSINVEEAVEGFEAQEDDDKDDATW